MVEHDVMFPTQHETKPAEPMTAVPHESVRAWWFPADRWVQIVIGIAVLALVVWALKGVFVAALVLLCPLMMIAMMFGMGHGMHRMHGGHHDHGDNHTQAPAAVPGADGKRALNILDERFARGEITLEQYEEMRRVLEPKAAVAEQSGGS